MPSKIQERPLPNPELLARANLPPSLTSWLRDLVQTLSFFISDIRYLQNEGKQTLAQLDVLENEPTSPQNGMVAYADGSNWDPGAGEGFYGYENGAWVKL